MAAQSLFSELNPQQRDAVVHPGGPLLVLAGAGSGKTRVITSRIVYLLSKGVPPHAILAVSFTNKAADEMRERMERMVPSQVARNLFLCTFHSLGLHILKQEKEALGFPQGFTIYDTADQLGVIREILKEAHIADRRLDVKAILFRISRLKNAGVSPEAFLQQVQLSKFVSEYDGFAAEVYPRYQQKMRAFCALDFDDLLLETQKLLETHETISKRWQRRFQHILVDEYQDTNLCQLALLKNLAASHQNVMVVGDDDQSIYSWRGASAENILAFDQHFSGAQTIKLEQNYRSTQNILDVANQVIAKNGKRQEKNLWSKQKEGSKIQLVVCGNEEEEAQFVASEIEIFKSHHKKSLRDMAILYRSNIQARPFEEALRQARIPYQMIGGQAFFDRKEIKDAMAYLKCLLNPRDEISLRRIINYPARGIGPATVDHIEQVQRTQKKRTAQTTLWDAMLSMTQAEATTPTTQQQQTAFVGHFYEKQNAPQEHAGKGAKDALSRFVSLMESFRKNLLDRNQLHSHIQAFFTTIGMADDFIRSEATATAAQRKIKNLDQFIESLVKNTVQSPLPTLEAMGQYLHKLSLQSREEDKAENTEDILTLSTLHGAKGLEFEVVFLVGVEEELLPHKRTLYPSEMDVSEPTGTTDLSEERRLFYVGITRARQCLYMTRAENRGTRGVPRAPSRFLEDVPPDLIETRSAQSLPAMSPEEEASLVQQQMDQLRKMLG